MRLIVGVSFLSSILLAAEAAVVTSSLIVDWSNILLDATKASKLPVTAASRNYAIFYEILGEALAAAECQEEGKSTAVGHSRDCQVISLSAAARSALIALYPATRHEADTILSDLHFQSMLRSDSRLEKLIKAGEKAALNVLSRRLYDESLSFQQYELKCQGGCGMQEIPAWRPTPPSFLDYPATPYWGNVDLFLVTDVEEFVPGDPPSPFHAEFIDSLLQVKDLGSKESSSRKEQDSQTALFWAADKPGTVTAAGLWIRGVLKLLQEKHLEYELAQSVEILQLLSAAIADAVIATWKTKYEYNVARPVTIIQNGILSIPPCPEWTPFLETPPFPEYTSGHAAIGAAAARILEYFFGRNTGITICSDDIEAERRYETFGCAAGEMALSRILGGVHYEFSAIRGEHLGRYVAQSAIKKWQQDS